jgi:D-xylose transport system permease protein
MSQSTTTSPEAPTTRRAFANNQVKEVSQRLRDGDLGVLPVIVGVVLIGTFFAFQSDAFLTSRNFSNLILQMAGIATISFGSVLVLLLGEVDLSAGPLSGFAAAVMGILVANHGWPAVPSILAALAVGCGCALLTGSIITGLGVPSFVVTLGASLAYMGLILIVLGDAGNVYISDPTIVKIASTFTPPVISWLILSIVVIGYSLLRLDLRRRRASLELSNSSIAADVLRVSVIAVLGTLFIWMLNGALGVPLVAWIVGGLAVALHYLTVHRRFGRHLYAVGGDKEASRRLGIGVKRVRLIGFCLASTLAAAGGVILASRGASVTTASGGGDLTLNAIAAAVVGGVSLFGGVGRIWQALLGAVVIAMTLNGMDLLAVSSGTKFVVIGSILVISVSIDAFTRNRRAAAGRL